MSGSPIPNDDWPNDDRSDDERTAWIDQQSDELLARALAAPAVDDQFAATLGEQLRSEFALIHGLEMRNGSATHSSAGSDPDSDVAIAGNIESARAPTGRRWWTVAAASLLIGMAFWAGRPSYSWAGMIEAVRRQPWIQSDLLQSGVVQVRRWVSAEWARGDGGVTASNTGGVVRFVDADAGVVLVSAEEATNITKSKIAEPRQRDDWQWMLEDLLGSPGEEFDANGWRFVEDSWRRGGTHNGRNDLIDLSVTFRSADGSLAVIQFLLDPETELPIAARRVPSEAGVADNDADKPTDEIRFEFAQQGPESIYDLGANREAPIVDGDAGLVSLRSTASAPKMTTPKMTPDTTAAPTVPSSAIETIVAGAAATANANDVQPAAVPEWSPEPEEPLPPPMADAELTARVDELLRKHWADVGIEPVGAASDTELLRRLQLDLTGRIPTVGEVRIFLEDTSPGRRGRLVDTLLTSRDHATHFASMWRRALIPRGVDLTPYGGPRKLEEWLADRLQQNTPHSDLARDVLLAEGRIRESGPLLFYAALKLNPEEIAAQTGRTFLGTRMECAQCHDHPFDERIAQEDFWAFAANFARISRPRGMIEIASPVLRVHDTDRGEVTLPDTETVIAPRLPLTDRKVIDADGWPSRREQFVNWLASPHNRRFARATVNRIWGQLFGRPLVEPIDDLRDDSVPLVPAVLDTLAADYARSGFDTRRLIRCLVMTDAYQLTSEEGDAFVSVDSPARTEVFARMNIKPFTAEQLHDAIAVASRSAAVNQGMADGGLVRFGDTSREAFIRLFEAPDDQAIDYRAGIPQALTLMHGQLIHSATDVSTSGMLRSLSAPFFSDAQRVETLFLATLSRLPSDVEREKMEAYVAQAEDRTGRQQKLGDVLWALLNSAEFTLNH